MNKLPVSKNIFWFYVFRAVELPIFLLPVFYLYLTDVKGLDPLQTATVLGLQEFALIFLEIPTGVIADKVSRKFSIGLGSILMWLPMAFVVLTQSYYMILILIFIKAVGKALISGADSSLLYDTLDDLGQTDKYKYILRKSRSLTFFVACVSIFTGAWIYQFNTALPFILPLIGSVIGAFAAYQMVEPDSSKKGKAIQDKNYFIHTLNSIKYLSKHKAIFLPIAVFALVEGVAVQLKWIYSPIFAELKTAVLLTGGFVTMIYIFKTLTSYINSKIPDSNLFNLQLPSLVSMLGFLAIAFFFNIQVSFIALLFIVFSEGLLISYTQSLIQKELDSSIRATAMSSINLISSIFATIVIAGFGFFHNSYTIQIAVGFIGGVYLIITILSYLLSFRKQSL